MKRYTTLWLLITMFVFVGCDVDELVAKAEKEIERVKHKYDEYIGEEDTRGERPFSVVYQENENDKTVLISSSCSNNNAVQHVYYENPTAAHHSFLADTNNLISYPGQSKLKPFWDIRYVDPVTKYMNGGSYEQYPNHGELTGLDVRIGNNNIGIGTDASKVEAGGGIAQSECINGTLVGGATINLFNAPEQYIHYAGPQSTFVYRVGTTSRTSPWKENGTGNLVMQGYFDRPIYNNYGDNIGGGVYMGLFIRNKTTGKFLNFVIGLYASGVAWIEEKSGIKYDPTTNIIHVATVAGDNTWWSTKSPSSRSIQEVFNTPDVYTSDDQRWDEFYRVNISYQNLLAVLNELNTNTPEGAAGQNFGASPQDWEITSIMIQYELEETGGKATFSGSFKGFEAYISENPL